MLFSVSPAPPPSFAFGVTAGVLLVTEHLRDLRMRRGKSREAVSVDTGISLSALRCLEEGAGPVSEKQVRALLSHYEGAATDDMEELVACLRDRDIVSDWMQGAGKRLATVERAATHVRTFTSHVVPPLAQTPSYAEAVAELCLADDHFGLAEADARRLAEGDIRAVLMILEEGLLRRRIGSPAVMEEQWARLQDLVERQWAEVLILPSSREVHLPAPHVAELVLRGQGNHYVFVNASHPDLVSYASGNNGARWHAWFNEIQNAALTPQDSFERLGQARKEAAR